MNFVSFSLLGAGCWLALAPCFAQSEPAKDQTLQTVVLTGNPLRNVQADAWVTRLGAAELGGRRGQSLGQLLDGLPGISSSAFGPLASRPVLRGLDGDRLRVLSNGGSALDASSLSPDHAVALDPLVVESIEVVRGPAALLYGGSAMGGVVNTLDQRVPKGGGQALAAELRAGGAGGDRQAAAVLDWGLQPGAAGWAWHVDASRRLSGEQIAPRHLVDGQWRERVRNSDGSQHAAAFGGGWVGAQGHAGISVDRFDAEYGSVVEESVRLAMARQRWAHEGEWRLEHLPIRTLRWQAANTRYRHAELEPGGGVGTEFRLHGSDARLEAELQPVGSWRGALGGQWELQGFEALGEEAFVPSTRTRQQAAFALLQTQQGPWQWVAGARTERIEIRSEGDGPVTQGRFGAATTRRFDPVSGALQATWRDGGPWRVQWQASWAQRAPTAAELFANGPHLATAAWERGDATLPLERARGQELAFIWEASDTRWQLNVFQQRFRGFISLQDSGQQRQLDDEVLPEMQFRAVPARLRGAELQFQHRLRAGGWAWTTQAGVDRVTGRQLDSGDVLPRLAPTRWQASLTGQQGPWEGRLTWRHVQAQNRVAPGDLPTPGYTTADLEGGYRFLWAGLQTQAAFKLQNVTNALGFNAVNVPTVRGRTPLAGRNLQIRLGFVL